MNARFWVWVNGDWCKLTLSPGQSLARHTFRHTEEGWYREYVRWSLEGGDENDAKVVREWAEEARDCDGRLDTSGQDYCWVASLADVETFDPDVRRPLWCEMESSQRDYAAEAMGY